MLAPGVNRFPDWFIKVGDCLASLKQLMKYTKTGCVYTRSQRTNISK